MIVTAERVPGALLRADRPFSPSASDLPLSGGTAAAFDVHLGSLPGLSLAIGVPVPLLASGNWTRAETVNVGNNSVVPLDVGGGIAITTSANQDSADLSYPFATIGLGGIAGVGIAPAKAMAPIVDAIGNSKSLLGIDGSEDSPTLGSGDILAPPAELPAAAEALTPETVRALAADVAGSMKALTDAMTALSSGSNPQALETTAATVAAVQAGLAQLAAETGQTLSTKASNLVTSVNESLASVTEDVGDLGADSVAATTALVGDVTASVSAVVAETQATVSTLTSDVTAGVVDATAALGNHVVTGLSQLGDAVADTGAATVGTVTTAAAQLAAEGSETAAATLDGVTTTAATLVGGITEAGAASVAAITAGATDTFSGLDGTVSTAVPIVTDTAATALDSAVETSGELLAGTDPAGGVTTLVSLLEDDHGFAVTAPDGETIFASAATALGDIAENALDGDLSTAVIDVPLLDDLSPPGLDEAAGGLLGGLNWDDHHG